MATESLETRLIEAIQPIRSYALAICLYHFFESGLFDYLASHQEASLQDLTEHFRMEPARLEGLLKFLRTESIVAGQNNCYRLTEKGSGFSDFKAWYTLLIGGYGGTFLEIGEKLALGSAWASRNLTQVGRGSCGISHYDAIPLTRTLITQVPGSYRRLLDLGCGNGLYLVEFCKAFPEIEALGVEPGEGSYREAQTLIRQEGLENRIHLVCSPALEFMRSAFEYEPDFAVLGFVLHEILAQEGDQGVIEFLTHLTDRFPNIHIIVIEVDLQLDNRAAMSHGLAAAYYNPYYLLHAFTCQRLETQPFWEQLFEKCQLQILAKAVVNPEVDSTGLEIGYLLRRRKDA